MNYLISPRLNVISRKLITIVTVKDKYDKECKVLSMGLVYALSIIKILNLYL